MGHSTDHAMSVKLQNGSHDWASQSGKQYFPCLEILTKTFYKPQDMMPLLCVTLLEQLLPHCYLRLLSSSTGMPKSFFSMFQ